MVSGRELKPDYWLESCPNELRQFLSCMIFNYHIFQAYNVKVFSLFSVPVLQVTCAVLEGKAIGEEGGGKRRNNVGEGK